LKFLLKALLSLALSFGILFKFNSIIYYFKISKLLKIIKIQNIKKMGNH